VALRRRKEDPNIAISARAIGGQPGEHGIQIDAGRRGALQRQRPRGRFCRGGVSASLSLRSDAAELSRLIGFGEEFACRNLLSSADRSRLLIILEELFTNTVNHGHFGRAPLGSIDIVLALAAGRLTIEFSDDGWPFDPLSGPLPDLDQTVANRQIGGLGLHIVRSLVDEARYTRDGNRNRLVLIRKIAPK
jgi:anti-sigma regulatory factor (Ser/Thr protein kinase)